MDERTYGRIEMPRRRVQALLDAEAVLGYPPVPVSPDRP